MLEGRCPKCGASFAGWALTDSQHHVCPECGAPLEITGSSKRGIKDIVPQSGDQHSTGTTTNGSDL